MALQSALEENSIYQDVNSNITYNVLQRYLEDDLKRNATLDETFSIRASALKSYLDNLYQYHYINIKDRSPIVKELFILHQTCRALERYNNEVLQISYIRYRSKILYPNIVYLLIRLMPNAKKFLTGVIRTIYSEIQRKSIGIIKRYTSVYYIDQDVIKQDVLYEFLGNALKKFNPLDIRDLNSFYKTVFRNIFHYYFRREQVKTIYSSFGQIDDDMNHTPTRSNLYREVLLSLQIEKFYQQSPTISQLSYNYNIFKRVITNNELQDMFFSDHSIVATSRNPHYKLISVYNSDLINDLILEQVKRLPTIFRLLKSVHIINPRSKPYNEMLIRPVMLKNAVLEELITPFKNIISDEHIYAILDKVSENFVDSILTGEYINLLSLSMVKINQLSFIEQVRKFVRICLDQTFKRDDYAK